MNKLRIRIIFFLTYIRTRVVYSIQFAKCRVLELLYSRYLYRIAKRDVSPIFIVGCGRSGNTVLARLLHENSGVCFSPENYTLKEVYYVYLKNIKKPWGIRVDAILTVLYSQEDIWRWKDVKRSVVLERALNSKEHTLGNIIDCWYMTYLEAIGFTPPVWGCKTPNVTPYMPKLLKIFPNAKFIYIIRNYKDTAQSYIKARILKNNFIGSILSLIKYRYFLFYANERMVNIVVDYETLANSPSDSIQKINEKIGLKSNKKIKYNNPDSTYQHLLSVNDDIDGSKKYTTYDFNNSDTLVLEFDYRSIVQKSELLK
jgi:protein-tyrosine sulfotransferase